MLKLRNIFIITALLVAMAASLSACKKNQTTEKLPGSAVESSTQESSAPGEGSAGDNGTAAGGAADGAQTDGKDSGSDDTDANGAGSGSGSNDGSGGTILEDEGDLEITVPDGIETYGE